MFINFNQVSNWPSGKVLGGSSTINMMQYLRGSPHDFDFWRDQGCEGWGYKDVLPYFLKAEDNLDHNLRNSGEYYSYTVFNTLLYNCFQFLF